MARYAGVGKTTIESCRSIDVLDWHRRGCLRSPRRFSWAWRQDGERVASINVETEQHRVTLKYRSRRYGEDWASVKCSAVYANGTYCGRQVTKLYQAGRLFACRHCSRLAYASQQESAHERGLLKAQRIRMQLGGTANMLDDFPKKPKGMHWRTYERLCRVHDAAQARSFIGLTDFAKRLRKRAS